MSKSILIKLIPILLVPFIFLCSCEKDNANNNGSKTLAEEILESGKGLRIGVAVADINPINDIGTVLEGYGLRNATGTHDSLTGRALIMMDDSTVIALLSLDLTGINRMQVYSLKTLIGKSTGIAYDNIFIHATHTHSAPTMVGPGVDYNYLTYLFDAVNNATLDALITTKNATPILKKGVADVGAINRRNPSQILKNEYTLIEFHGSDNKNIATLLNYSCHPVVLGPNNYKITADYVHYLRNEIEAELGGTAMFFNGSYGNINPPTTRTNYPYDRSMGTFAKSEKMGVELANKMINEFTIQDTLDIQISSITKEGNYLGNSASFSVLNLGEIQIAMIPGEPLELFGQQVMGLFPGPYKIVFGSTNDFIAYIIPGHDWQQCTSSFTGECFEETLSDENLAPILLQGFEEISSELF